MGVVRERTCLLLFVSIPVVNRSPNTLSFFELTRLERYRILYPIITQREGHPISSLGCGYSARPLDAQTLYLATRDTSIYITTAVLFCSSYSGGETSSLSKGLQSYLYFFGGDSQTLFNRKGGSMENIVGSVHI